MTDLVISTRLTADAKGLVGEIRVSNKELDKLGVVGKKTGSKLKGMGNEAKKAADKTLRLNQQGKTLTSTLFNVRSAVATLGLGLLVRGVINTNTEFQSLSASLKTVTGSSAAARKEFLWIDEFTSQTPFQLQEVTAAFIKLKSLGLQPSMAALRSFGNTSSAMGKSLNQFVEAVADAVTGEFERLKEFGIKASSQGEKVTLTFQGIATTIGKNAREIEGYLRRIGKVEFAGAMAEQMKTLKGVFSNLGDNVSRFHRAIGRGGLNDAISVLSGEFSVLIGESMDLGEQIGSAMSTAAYGAADAFKFLAENGDEALAVLSAIAAAKTVEILGAITVAARTAAIALAKLAFTPLGALVLALSAVVGAVVYFRDEVITTGNRTAAVTDYMVASWEILGESVSAVWEHLEAFAGGPWGQGLIDVATAIGSAYRSMFNGMIGTFASIVDIAVISAAGIADAFEGAIDFILDLFTDLGTASELLFSGEFSQAGDAAAEAFTKSFEGGMAGTGERIGAALDDSFNKDWLGDWMGAIWQGAGDLTAPVIDGVAARAAERYRQRIAGTLGANRPDPSRGARSSGGANLPGDPGGTGTGGVAQLKAHEKAVKDITDKYLDLLPVYDRMVIKANTWRENALNNLDATKEGYSTFRAQVDEIYNGMMSDAYKADMDQSKEWSDGVIRGLRSVSAEARDMASQSERAVTNFANTSENEFVSLMRGTKSVSEAFSSMADSIIDDLLRIAWQKTIADPVGDAFGGILESILKGSVGGVEMADNPNVAIAHTGGMAGSSNLARRSVPAGVFKNAPRFHTGGMPGLSSNEIPVITKRGEGIFTPEQMNNADRLFQTALQQPAPVVNLRVNVHPSSGSGGQKANVEQTQNGDGSIDLDIFFESVEEHIAQNIESGRGSVSSAIEGRYNLNAQSGGLS